jgi:hypothetical protein
VSQENLDGRVNAATASGQQHIAGLIQRLIDDQAR